MAATVEPTVWARTKTEITRRGWTKGHYRNPRTGAVCVLGALAAALHGDPQSVHRADVDELADRLDERVAGGSITVWNDSPGRRVEDVYALLDALDAEDRKAGGS